ncbi:hypothetical protein D3C81_1702610 [compost metagenome]
MNQRRNGFAFAVGDVIQRWLSGYVVIPQVMVSGLECPALFARPYIQGYDRGGVLVFCLGSLSAPEVRRGIACGEVNQAELLVVGRSDPYIWSATGISLPFRRKAVYERVTQIPSPDQLTCYRAEGTDHTGRFAHCNVVIDTTANDDEITRYQRRRGLRVDTRAVRPHPFA